VDGAERYNYDDRGRGQIASDICAPGITRCGADGQVQRCTDSNSWSPQPGSYCSR
jgi:hypothetical protein